MDLTPTELISIITASGVAAAGAFKGLGALGKWAFSSRLSREQWVEERVRAAFGDIEKTAAQASARADALARRVDALEFDKMSLLAVSQALVFELGRLDPSSPVLTRAQTLLNRMGTNEPDQGQ
jgi:hypothetical protein